jgi:hypothetical protein
MRGMSKIYTIKFDCEGVELLRAASSPPRVGDVEMFNEQVYYVSYIQIDKLNSDEMEAGLTKLNLHDFVRSTERCGMKR